jgi:lipopolysaccharide/colanic/teichoic acid biosynthesis glycosyltransferase
MHSQDLAAMIQTSSSAAQTRVEDGACAEAPPRIWGFSARELHDAFWRSKGVQCVRRGRPGALERGADLFLLLEPDQLVLFEIAPLIDRLTWHSAGITRLRLVDQGQERYSEHVVRDARGIVQRIERRYRPAVRGCSRVMLAFARRVASAWMTAPTRREGWDRARRCAGWSPIDHCKCPGTAYTDGDVGDERHLIESLIERWPRPDRAITGLEQIEPGIWHAAGESSESGVTRIGPVWLGRGNPGGRRPVLVGPAWTDDRTSPEQPAPLPVLKNFIDIELPDHRLAEARRRLVRAYPALKRLMDIALSVVALLVTLPLMGVIALSILVEDGRPLFFGHRRQGRNGKTFRCWKFRTMHRNAEQCARQLESRCDGPQVLIPNDPRVTRVGRFLRRTNLDEIPQFWNVLLGHMSLVGPRPSPDDENQFCPAWRDLRLSVRPGITGLWQLKRTREPGEDFQEWIKYDIQYVERASLRLDLTIMVRTAWMLLFTRRSNRAHRPSG